MRICNKKPIADLLKIELNYIFIYLSSWAFFSVSRHHLILIQPAQQIQHEVNASHHYPQATNITHYIFINRRVNCVTPVNLLISQISQLIHRNIHIFVNLFIQSYISNKNIITVIYQVQFSSIRRWIHQLYHSAPRSTSSARPAAIIRRMDS
jgi:hypothetical protein